MAFTVREGFRGVTASTIEVSTGPAAQRCSLAFTIGHEYIVFADRAEGANGAAAGRFTTVGVRVLAMSRTPAPSSPMGAA